MITALIFAGGTGKRMNSNARPKQFLYMKGKPIIIYTLENFEKHKEIDNIIIVCLEGWIHELENEIHKFGITKVRKVVPGGRTGHDSIYCGLNAMKDIALPTDIVLIHDGVRPFITTELITKNIEAVKKYGSAITAEVAKESIIMSENGIDVDEVPLRTKMYVSKAPQSFFYGDIKKYFEMAEKDSFKSIDCSHLLSHYHFPMHMVQSTKNNIKITEPADYYVMKALFETMENQEIFGI